MRKVLLMVVALALLAIPASAKQKVAKPAPKGVKRHALVKATMALVAAPVAAGKGLRYTLGSVLFAVEAGNDVVLAGLYGVDQVASKELKHNPFHYVYVVDNKVDKGLEVASLYFFGVTN